jgi:hypothetical protein
MVFGYLIAKTKSNLLTESKGHVAECLRQKEENNLDI